MNDDQSLDVSNIDAIRYKVVLVGDISVGKTSIMNRFFDIKYQDSYDPTIGVDYHLKELYYRSKVIKLQFWDSAGQEKYRSLIPSYVRGSSLIFIVFDLASKCICIYHLYILIYRARII